MGSSFLQHKELRHHMATLVTVLLQRHTSLTAQEDTKPVVFNSFSVKVLPEYSTSFDNVL